MANNSRNALILGSNPGLRDAVKTNLRGLGFEVLKSTASGAVPMNQPSMGQFLPIISIIEVAEMRIYHVPDIERQKACEYAYFRIIT